VKAKDFKIRERLECIVLQNKREVHFLVRVQDIESGRIRVDQPVVDQRILHLEVGTNMKVHFHRPDGSYEFETYIIGKDQINMPCLILAEPQNVVRHQRREYFRVDTSIDTTLTPVAPPTNGDTKTFLAGAGRRPRLPEQDTKPVEGEIVNISAGGAKVKISTDDFQRFGRSGEQFLLNFELPTRINLESIHAEIVNLQKFPDGLCFFHLRFTKISDALRKEIVVFNFHRQRNQLKRWSNHNYYHR
jgi:c-di-GMP-binding flagellar brake protein YcgR